MKTILFLLLGTIIFTFSLFNKNIMSKGIFTWKTKYIGITLTILGVFATIFFDLKDDVTIRNILVILGLTVILLSKDRIKNSESGAKKTEIFMLSFLICTLAFLSSSFLSSGFEFLESVSVFIISVLFSHIIVYHLMIYINRKKHTA